MVNKKISIIILFFLIVPACKSIHLQPPPPSPQLIQIGITPSLLPRLREGLEGCAKVHPGIAINLEIITNSILDDEAADIHILLGEPGGGTGDYAFQLGWEEIVVITTLDSKIDSGNLESIRELFTTANPTRMVLTYPKGDQLRILLQDAVLGAEEITPYALVVSEPGEMVQSILQNTDSIGYIPESWATRDLKVIPLDPGVQETLRLPVLGLTLQEPDGLVRNFLACLQNSWDQDSE
jgi:hypothetical protein